MKRHVIVIGKTGQLARALSQQAVLDGIDMTCFDRAVCDLSASPREIREFALNLPLCDGIIIAAAYTAVDEAEDNEDIALHINGDAPAIFAELCQERSIPLVHVSTDYVFNQEDHSVPIRSDMPTAPINAYGRSKLVGENNIVKSGARTAILRTSWVFDGIGKNFMTTMLRLAETRDTLSVVSDQIGRPTYAGHLAQACLATLNKLIDQPKFQGGIYHVSNAGRAVSWADFAIKIFSETRHMRDHDVTVMPVSSSQYPTVAKRPQFSVLDISTFEREFAMTMPNWEDGLSAALIEWRDRGL